MNVVLLALVGCRTENDVSAPVPVDDIVRPLVLVVDEPLYGTFVGDRATVSGSVSDPSATVWIEGYRARVGTNGTFRVEVPVTGDFRVIDIEATRPPMPSAGDSGDAPGEHLRERRPVFSGADPMIGWTGGIGLRLTPVALDHVAELVQTEVDALDLAGQIDALLPSLALGGLAFVPAGTTMRPAEVSLVSGPDGLALTITLHALEVALDVTTEQFGTTPVVLGLDTITLGIGVDLSLDADGNLLVAVTDPILAFGDPVVKIGAIEPTFLEGWVAGLTDGIAGLLEGALGLGVGLIDDLVIPFAGFETDALGFPLVLSLADAHTDTDGVGLLLGMDLGTPATAPLVVPSRIDAGPQADLALSVHEGLMQGLLGSDLLSLLDLDLELPGFLGEVVALPIAALPGGEQLPGERTGMCLSLVPGEARVARLKPELAPLAVLTLPDVSVTVGVSTATATCAPWIEASLAVQALFDAEGTTLAARFAVVDGAVLAYGAEGAFDEDEIVAGLGGLVDVATSLLGTSFAIDLSTLFGGAGDTDLPLGALAPRMLDATAGSTPGEVVVGLSLWD